MTTYRLLGIDGTLYFPHGGTLAPVFGEPWTCDRRENAPVMLLCRYFEGDCDRATWPLRNDRDRRILAKALFDERECNEFFPTDATIELPDGTIFDFDLWVS